MQSCEEKINMRTTLSCKILGKRPEDILLFVRKLEYGFGGPNVIVTSGVRNSDGENKGSKYDFPYYCFVLVTIDVPEIVK